LATVAERSGGCAPGPNQSKVTASEHDGVAGFWLGLWHGFIAPFVFVASLFKSNLSIYEVHTTELVQRRYLFGQLALRGSATGRRVGSKSQ